jgi:spermidine synthase
MTTFVTTPLFELAVRDAVDWLRAQPADSIDLIVTDPAYDRGPADPSRLPRGKAARGV